ncbi:TadG family pilus assembly protein [Dyella caseinilytica]|nr:TadG family pilus assembly protein [Dyella caseinilytica]GGA01850.1 hypothetical protein GCM10011408_24050 [Dyella caseinilytica]
MAINMMLILLGLIGMLGLVEVGYLYWAKRDTQKVADLASLAGAQQLQDCSAANTGNSAALGNATSENGFSGTLNIACGTWSAAATTGNADGFTASAAGATPSAVKVVASRPVTPFFAFTSALPNVSAEAVATNTNPTAVFSIGTTLVGVNGAAPLEQFLAGIGINPGGTSLVGYQGLANVYITPSGLLQQLGVTVPTNLSVGGLNTLLAAQTNVQTLANVLNAIVVVGNQQALTSANVSLLSTIDAAVGNIPLNVTLGSSGSTPSGLFAQIIGPDSSVNDALNAQVNALQLLETAIGVATTGHAINAQSLNLSLPSTSNPLITLTSAASVIEPPSIGIGGVGTTAYTAQIRIFLDITTPNNGFSLLGGAINLDLNLPIAIDVANAQAELTSLCNTTSGSGTSEATIAVTSSVLKMCVGNLTQANAFSTTESCDQIPNASTPEQLFKLSVGSTNLASLTTSFATNALTGNSSVTLTPGETATTGDTLNIGTSVNNLVTALTTALIANSSSQTSASSSQTALQTATDLWNQTPSSDINATRLSLALNSIQTSSTGLQGTLGNVTSSVTDLLGNTVTLNVTGLLGDVGNLLGSVTNTLLGIVGDLVCTAGSSTACINVIEGALNSGGSGTGTNSNAFVGLIGFLLQALQQPLNDVGSQVLTPILSSTGLQLGENTVNLQSLQCHNVQLVY